ncbi:MAG: hypothetical protein HKN29_03770 [Rhodothermales bacterium]|nr:hypothetical protein [Rhodothermales bacterium]
MHRIFLALLIVALAACDDPSPVGIDLVDEQSGTPYVLEVPSSQPESSAVLEATGNAARALFGTVDDPLLGRTETRGYVDFVAPTVLTQNFENTPIEAASLLLLTDYVYGDSVSEITVSLRSVDLEWSGTGATSDTTIFVGDVVTESLQRPQSGVFEIPLPQDWVAQWDTTMRGTTFADAFHGFELSTTTSSAVIGTQVLGSSIRAIAAGDTSFFSAGRSLTRVIDPTGPSAVPAGYVLQDGQGLAAAFRPQLGQRPTAVLNRGIVRIPADTSLSVDTPHAFARPPIETLQLDWISLDGTRTAIAAAVRGSTHFEFESIQLHDSLSVFLQGGGGLDRLQVRVPDQENTLSVILLPTPPVLHLAVTPVQQ